MATQARITLTALNGEDSLHERIFTLHPHLRTIQIGRASKTPSKGLQAAVDNAWFDSPVMSRNHAEMLLDAERCIIMIQDIGSMHGTFVNDFQLQHMVPHVLNNGDLIVFGAEVKRNLDTFPACVFRVNYEFLPFKANISYAFPESDDDDYAISEDEMKEKKQPSSEDSVSIESPPHKISQAINAIDLTRDDSPVALPTGENPVEKDLVKIMDGQPADIDHLADPVNIAIYAENPPILIESDDEDTHFSLDSEDLSDEVEDDDGGASARGDGIDEQDSSGNENDIDHEVDLEDNSTPELRDFADKESEQASTLASRELYTCCGQPTSQSNLQTIFDATENIVENGESDFGLSDAGAEGIRALFDDGLVDNPPTPYFDNESDPDSVIACEASVNATFEGDKVETPKQATISGLSPYQLARMAPSVSYNENARFSQTQDYTAQSAFYARQPSPSDAAMVKAATSTVLNQVMNPIKVYHLPSLDFQKFTSQSLGDKTGKHAFFAAREANKAKVCPGEDDKPEGSSSLQTAENEIHLTAEEKKKRSIIAFKRYRERKKQVKEKEAKIILPEMDLQAPSAATRAVNSAVPPLPILPYLDDHTQVPKKIRTPSPEPDMTSAVVYNESKASMASANKCISTQFGQYGLSIHDIIEGTVCGHTSQIPKRKADDISDAIDDEIRAWATSSSAPDKLTDTATSDVQAAICESQIQAAPLPVSDTEQRPAKRLRRIVESVGYIALGGATLFGALVLSAPDFL